MIISASRVTTAAVSSPGGATSIATAGTRNPAARNASPGKRRRAVFLDISLISDLRSCNRLHNRLHAAYVLRDDDAARELVNTV
ncbi:hypothetical protein Acsp01_24850 [Actinoplanes sp. NBRC 101535]|nr:hypothetical protein Acsp01_24850 [Actinoplanes sp. NBRC 101535]